MGAEISNHMISKRVLITVTLELVNVTNTVHVWA